MTKRMECEPETGSSTALEVVVTRDPHAVEAAQRLRYRIFGVELGATLPNADDGLDSDTFDPLCDHLLVRDTSSGAAARPTTPRRVRSASTA